MKIFDEKFLKDKNSYILQCILATLSAFWILLVLDFMSDGIVIASLGASSFIVFTMPKAQVSNPRFLIGGYSIGILTGSLCHFLQYITCTVFDISPQQYSLGAVFGALGIGAAIFLMVITDTEHPPAAALSLGIVLSDFNFHTILVALTGIISLCVIKKIFGRHLKNLL